MQTRTYLAVPYEARAAAKALGGKWDTTAKRWYVPEGADPAPFARWAAAAPAAKPATPTTPAPTSAPRLTIEIVPETAWRSNVRDHVPPETWRVLQRATFSAAGYRCEVCSGVGPSHPVEAHEVWHYDDAAHHQSLVRLQALCPACHEVKHFGLARVRGNDGRALAHLARVNGWDEPTARKYVDAVFRIAIERRRHQWSLDMSWLDRAHGLAVASKRPPTETAAATPAPAM